MRRESPCPLTHMQVVLNAVSDAVCSYLLAFFFQSSHNISEVEWPTPDQDNFLGTDWYVCVCVCVCVCACVHTFTRGLLHLVVLPTKRPLVARLHVREPPMCHVGLCCKSRQLRTMPLTAGSGPI